MEETVYRFRASIDDDPHDLIIRIEGPPAIVATGSINLGSGLNLWLVASLLAGLCAVLAMIIIVGRRKHRLLSLRMRAANGA